MARQYRRGYSARGGKNKKRVTYALRMNQLLGPYSIGAIYPCDSHTDVMIAGLDSFNTSLMDEVVDPRLSMRIGVDCMYRPPAFDENGGATIPAVRFPGWLYCNVCGYMLKVGLGDTSEYVECPNCKANKDGNKRRAPKMVTERFVVACPRGHIDEFPIREWVHDGKSVPIQGHAIKRITTGRSATLGDIVYVCSCGARRSLSGASSGGLASIGYRCTGRKPWLAVYDECECAVSPNELRVIQKGGTNVAYADTVTSVLIPDIIPKEVWGIVSKQKEKLESFEEKGLLDDGIDMIADSHALDRAVISMCYERLKEDAPESTDSSYLYEEYCTLKDPKLIRKDEFSGRTVAPEHYSSKIMRKYLTGVTLVDTITVTRALVGFSRLIPPDTDGKSFKERRRILSETPKNWTLAIQTRGEGIFFDFIDQRLDSWLENPAVLERFSTMQENLDASRKAQKLDSRKLNPKYVLLHTLAHLVLLSISEVCGYAAASLQERIYCDRYWDDDTHSQMCGLLIYTASDSSDGSLGGLVRAGRPGRFERILEKALHDALWCSGDPVCMDSRGQGPGSCNLAACYNCALLPETSCEVGNKFLDRGLVVGTIECAATGLFGDDLRR